MIRAGRRADRLHDVLGRVAGCCCRTGFTSTGSTSYGIDGGPLGFLTWSIPTIVGTLACDTVMSGEGRSRVGRMFAWVAILMGLGYVLSCLTTLYNVPEHRVAELKGHETAADPVLPDAERCARNGRGNGPSRRSCRLRTTTIASTTTG